MKFLIMALVMLTWTNVKAESKYTDYEFQGYTQEKLEADELFRYEKTTFNKFYKEKETNITYLKSTDNEGYEFVDTDEHFYEEYLREKPLPGFDLERRVLLYASEHIEIDSIYLKAETPIEDLITTLKIRAKDDPIDYDIEYLDDKTKINLNGAYIYSDLNFDIEYKAEEDELLTFSILNPNWDVFWNHEIELPSNFNYLYIHILEDEDFMNFIHKNYFNFREILTYYKNYRTMYKHYDIEKVYYIDSEETELEGYTFDPNESYTMYKIYKREKLEETLEPSDKPVPEGPPKSDQDENAKPDLKEEIVTNKNKENTSKKEIAINFNPDKKEELIERKEELKEKDEVICNCKYSPLTEIPTACENEAKNSTKILTLIGFILIAIALIELAVYIFSVNTNDKNG